MIEREVSGTPQPADSGVSYVPPAHRPAPEDKPHLGYQIDGRTLVERIAAGATPSTGDGFALDPDDLDAISTEWEKLADAYADKQRMARQLLEVEGPGAEYASAIHSEAVRSAGAAMIAAFEDRQRYCTDQASNFRTAADRYAKTDNDNRHPVDNNGTSPAGSAL